MKTNNSGLLLCARYSVAPNFFGYCGPDKNKNLIDHIKDKVADKEVQTILSQFETLFNNLTLIAYENGIKDVFNKQVVEAYWLGNSLLNNIKRNDYISLLKEKLKLDKKIGTKNLLKLQHKFLTTQILPHHSFHVFNIFKRTGNDPSLHSLYTLDECRIGWGKIKKIQSVQNKIKKIIVETKPLVLRNKKLIIGESLDKEIAIDYRGKSFADNIKIGDWISYHWGFFCDILTHIQVKNLEYYTKKAIDFYNQP